MTRTKRAVLGLTALFMVTLGVLHMVYPAPFLRIMPPWLPAPAALVAVSGVAEIAGGMGLLVPRLRRPAAFGLIAIYIAVFPANVYQAMHAVQVIPGANQSSWTMWLRLPFQALFIANAWWLSKRDSAPPR